jgi:acetyltransferase-like isoleucine patch superfamily enzyme
MFFIRKKGKNNRIIIVQNGQERPLRFLERIQGLRIRIRGNNNTVKIGLPMKAIKSKIGIKADNSLIEIGANTTLRQVAVDCNGQVGQTLKIGKDTIMGITEIYLGDASQVLIGENCMFAHNVYIWAADAHPILDKNTNEIINTQKNPLVIGDNCWLGKNVTLTKNVVLPNNTIVATGSVVTKRFSEEYTAIAGNPADVVKTDVIWKR